MDYELLLLIGLMGLLGLSALRVVYEIFFRADTDEQPD